MKKILLTTVALFAFASAALAANTYRGQWEYEDNPDGWETLVLMDNASGYTLALGGSERYCKVPGASYATMRRVLEQNYEQKIVWWVDQFCNGDDHVRVCIKNYLEETACSTYLVRDEE